MSKPIQKKKFGNLGNPKMPNRAALLQQKHINRGNDNRAFFDSADWAGNLSKGPGPKKGLPRHLKNFRQAPQHHPKPGSDTHEQIEHNPTSALGASAAESETPKSTKTTTPETPPVSTETPETKSSTTKKT